LNTTKEENALRLIDENDYKIHNILLLMRPLKELPNLKTCFLDILTIKR
jgi:hypothetical protein